ncbi:MAG: hypothetical protein N3G21_06015 [Candidatus Hydrogenedentes bacterium]|nr:hypothetical protein [Candidatus Hydrogenedentota bacterium]
MPYYRVHIYPTSPIHRGIASSAGKSSAIIHSDTLHAALLCVSTLIDKNEYWLKQRALNLKISSAYPFFKDREDKIIYLYPRPFPIYKPVSNSKEKDPTEDKKKWKRVKYLSESALSEYLKRPDKFTSLPLSSLEFTDEPSIDPKENFGKFPTCCLKDEVEILANRPRVIVKDELLTSIVTDRGGNYETTSKDKSRYGTTPFQRSYIRVNTDEGAGLWFIVELSDEELPEFNKLLRILGILGIGGERTIGYGHFEFNGDTDIQPFSSQHITIENISDYSLLCFKDLYNPEQKPNSILSLSLYHPTKEEFHSQLFGGYASYECAIRSGWICEIAGTTKPRMSVRMCLEGSSFPIHIDGNPNNYLIPRGDVVDTREYEHHTPHPVWRSGLLLGISFYNQHIKYGDN